MLRGPIQTEEEEVLFVRKLDSAEWEGEQTACESQITRSKQTTVANRQTYIT